MPDAPITNLQVVQRGVEVTPGTLVAATHRAPIEPGSVSIGATIDRIRRRYSGSLATSHQSSSGLTHVTLSYDERGYYDYLAVLLRMFLAPTAAGTGAGADKSWTFTPSDSADNLTRMSHEIGGRDTWAAEEKISGCVGSTLEITWNKTDDWMCAVTVQGVRNTQAAKTGALTLPATLVPILGKLTRCYIDPTTFGTTSYGRALSGVIRIENAVAERFGTDGLDYPNRIAVLQRTVTSSLIVEYDATTIRDAWRAGTLQKLRVEAPGPALGASTYNARFDIAGTWETSEIGDDDGIVTLAHDYTAEYNTGLGADISALVVNSLAATP